MQRVNKSFTLDLESSHATHTCQVPGRRAHAAHHLCIRYATATPRSEAGMGSLESQPEGGWELVHGDVNMRHAQPLQVWN